MISDEQLRLAFATLIDRLHDDVRREVQITVDQALAGEPSSAADIAGHERLLDSVRRLGGARALGEILDTLAMCAAREAQRAAVLTLRGGRAHGWRLVGFGPLDRKPPVDLLLDDVGVVAGAVSDNAVTSGLTAPAFAERPQGAPCIALPIAVAGEVVAVLYADDGSSGGGLAATNAVALEILTRYAAQGIEAMIACRLAWSLAMPASGRQTPGAAAGVDEIARVRVNKDSPLLELRP